MRQLLFCAGAAHPLSDTIAPWVGTTAHFPPARVGLLASKLLNQLALGGRVEMPAWDKNGNPVRDHRKGCPGNPRTPCGCPLVLVEKVLLPESRILMWQCDRIDPH